MFKGFFPKSSQSESEESPPIVATPLASANSDNSSDSNDSSEEQIVLSEIPKLGVDESISIPINANGLENNANNFLIVPDDSFDPFSPNQLKKSKSLSFNLKKTPSIGFLTKKKSVQFNLVERDEDGLISPINDEDQSASVLDESLEVKPAITSSSVYSSHSGDPIGEFIHHKTLKEYRSYESEMQGLYTADLKDNTSEQDPNQSTEAEIPAERTSCNQEIDENEQERFENPDPKEEKQVDLDNKDVLESLHILANIAGKNDISVTYSNNYELSNIIYSLGKMMESKLSKFTEDAEAFAKEMLQVEQEYVHKCESLSNEVAKLAVENQGRGIENAQLESDIIQLETKLAQSQDESNIQLNEFINERDSIIQLIQSKGYQCNSKGEPTLIHLVTVLLSQKECSIQELERLRSKLEDDGHNECSNKIKQLEDELRVTKSTLNQLSEDRDKQRKRVIELEREREEEEFIERDYSIPFERTVQEIKEKDLIIESLKSRISAAKTDVDSWKSFSKQQSSHIQHLSNLLIKAEDNFKEAGKQLSVIANMSGVQGKDGRQTEQQLIEKIEELSLQNQRHQQRPLSHKQSIEDWKAEVESLIKEKKKIEKQLVAKSKNQDLLILAIKTSKERLRNAKSERESLQKSYDDLEYAYDILFDTTNQILKGCFESLVPLLYDDSIMYFSRLYKLFINRRMFHNNEIVIVEKLCRFLTRSVEDLATQFRSNEDMLEKEIQDKITCNKHMLEEIRKII
ncbi:uncharacterized protein RJT20DRAFT_16705 [Scheffersomyces xylosifermentans]|uniref:uncharacterized protein n=1 Tax=Scheffersomyces xylosifermentans TaxID=1304137 RepID=UPI00315C9605